MPRLAPVVALEAILASSKSPHDGLFRFVFSQHEAASALLGMLLPKEVARRAKWSTLRALPTGFVDAELSERHSDLCFSLRIGRRRALVYVLLEHQSSPERLMPLRLLGYMHRMWMHYLGEHPRSRRLPLIIPLVVSNTRGPWRAPRRFKDLMALDAPLEPELARFVPQFEYLVQDLLAPASVGARRPLESAIAELTLRLLATARTDVDVLTLLSQSYDLLGAVQRAPNGLAALVAIAHYTLAQSAKQPAAVRRLFHKLGTEGEVAHMTAAHILTKQARLEGRAEGRAEGRSEGRAEGRAEGRTEGRAALIVQQLAARFGKLPESVQARVHAASERALDAMAVRLLSAESLDEVLALANGRGGGSRQD
ncbi:MAG: Rpn family recombination-promoting nuclease/putative transposase [Polyangiaceae bacterium]